MLILFWQVAIRIRDNLLTMCGILLMWHFCLPTSSWHCLLFPVLPPPTSFRCHHYCLVQTIPLPEPGKLLYGIGILQLPRNLGASQVGELCVPSQSYGALGWRDITVEAGRSLNQSLSFAEGQVCLGSHQESCGICYRYSSAFKGLVLKCTGT